ncbi:MAG: selenide, water dikinase SelD, partial [Paraburkholderia sp.]
AFDGVHAMTDVTGFGLLGHTLEIARGAGLTARVRYADLPFLPGVEALAADGVLTGASGRNWASYGDGVKLGADLPVVAQALLTDPQTSGGLLIACAPDCVADVLAIMHADGFADARIIGELDAGPARVEVA